MTAKNPIDQMIEEIIDEKLSKLTKADVREIVNEAMPDLDQLIANKIKEHFYQIGNFLVEKFKDPGE